MEAVLITRADFLQDRQGRTFADVAKDSNQPLDAVLAFFSDSSRQRRMQESEIHHDRPPLAGVVRELENDPAIDRFLAADHPQLSKRLRQAIGVVVRMIMERQGWRKTGKKGSLGVRAAASAGTPDHNTGGLAYWFIRAERYELEAGMPYCNVRQRGSDLAAEADAPDSSDAGRQEAPKTRVIGKRFIHQSLGEAR